MTIVYTNGGDEYRGKREDNSLRYWKKLGIDYGQRFLYKGYRYFDNKKDQVVVYDTEQWDEREIARRKANGFMGIREYALEG